MFILKHGSDLFSGRGKSEIFFFFLPALGKCRQVEHFCTTSFDIVGDEGLKQ